MNKQDIFVLSGDGKTNLHGIIWEPECAQIKGVVQLVHGMCEYIDRYHDFAVYLTEQGYAVIGHDHLGHGKSMNSPADQGFFADENGNQIVVEDIHRIMEFGRERWYGKPWFVLGHSMGSFMVRRYITHYSEELAGAIIMGTGMIPGAVAKLGRSLAVMIGKTKGLRHPSKLLSDMVLGGNNKPFKPARTECDWLTKDEEIVDRYVADPLCGFMFTAGAFKDFFTVMVDLAEQKEFEKIRKNLPILITMGEVDPVGGAKAGEALRQQFEQLGMKDVSLDIYPGDRHEILNELDRKTVYGDILKWIEKR